MKGAGRGWESPQFSRDQNLDARTRSHATGTLATLARRCLVPGSPNCGWPAKALSGYRPLFIYSLGEPSTKRHEDLEKRSKLLRMLDGEATRDCFVLL